MGKLTGDTNADMILSSADILRILGSNELIRLSASVDIVDSKPLLSGKEGVYIHINRFPSLQEFEATWDIWIEADEELDLVLAEMRRILPRMEVVPGLLTLVTTTEFRSESTQGAPGESSSAQAQIDLSSFEDRFQSLVEDVQDRMLLISSGRAGKNGQDGRDGVDGRDGKDIDATETELFDLQDVEQSVLPMEKGQVLTWDGGKWIQKQQDLPFNFTVRQEGTCVENGGNGNETRPLFSPNGEYMISGARSPGRRPAPPCRGRPLPSSRGRSRCPRGSARRHRRTRSSPSARWRCFG